MKANRGNTTNHPSRAGIPLKDGRTTQINLRITPDALTKLKAIVASRKQSRSDYLQEKIDEDYANIQQGEIEPMKFKVLTDSSYTGGLSFLNRFEDVITEPDAEFDENGNEYYTITSERTDIRSLLDDCDAVISYEEVKK